MFSETAQESQSRLFGAVRLGGSKGGRSSCKLIFVQIFSLHLIFRAKFARRNPSTRMRPSSLHPIHLKLTALRPKKVVLLKCLILTFLCAGSFDVAGQATAEDNKEFINMASKFRSTFVHHKWYSPKVLHFCCTNKFWNWLFECLYLLDLNGHNNK